MFKTVNGLRVWQSGSASSSKPTIIMFPGFGAGAEFLIPTARALSLQYQVMCFDMPGFGRSPWPKDGNLEIVVKQLADTIRLLKDRRVVFVGQSVGGLMALEVATVLKQYGDPRCIGVCLIGGAHHSLIQLSWRRPGSVGRFFLAVATVCFANLRMPRWLRNFLIPNAFMRRLLLWPYLAYLAKADPEQLTSLLENSGSWQYHPHDPSIATN